MVGSTLIHVDFGPNDHRDDALHFTYLAATKVAKNANLILSGRRISLQGLKGHENYLLIYIFAYLAQTKYCYSKPLYNILTILTHSYYFKTDRPLSGLHWWRTVGGPSESMSWTTVHFEPKNVINSSFLDVVQNA